MTKSKVKPLPCLGNDTLCHGDMCTVELQVGLDDDDEKDVVHAPARVYVVDSQKIVWTATSYQANDTDVPMVTEVSFTALGSGKDAPSPAASATCSAGVCTVYGTNFDTCGVYKYSVVVKHHKKNKKADPELEVAGTTTVSPTGTSGTTGTTGTR